MGYIKQPNGVTLVRWSNPMNRLKTEKWWEGIDGARERMFGGYPPVLVYLDEDGLPRVRGKGPDVPHCALFQANDEVDFCWRSAGQGTPHPGTGLCYEHGGNRYARRVEGAFVTAHAIAMALDVDPWEAIEVALRRAYAWSAFYHAKLAEVTDDDDLRPGGAAHDWVKGAERTTELVAKYAKMCHDMNIAEHKLRVIELQGQMIAQVLASTLHELGLSSHQEDRARVIMESMLKNLAAQQQITIAGELEA